MDKDDVHSLALKWATDHFSMNARVVRCEKRGPTWSVELNKGSHEPSDLYVIVYIDDSTGKIVNHFSGSRA